MILTKIALKNPYTVFVIMFLLSVLGIIALKNIPIALNPDVTFPEIDITTNYSGAAPNVVEAEITTPLEREIHGIPGIKKITSTSGIGSSSIAVEFNLDKDPNIAIQEVRDKVEIAKAKFNKNIDSPIVSGVSTSSFPAISVMVSSQSMSLNDLSSWVELVASAELQTIVGVASVDSLGAVERQMRINIDPNKLYAYGVTLDQVNLALATNNNNYPAGFLTNNNQNINLLVNGKLSNEKQFSDIIVSYRGNSPILLGNVATVTADAADDYNPVFYNGKPALELAIKISKGANLVEVSNQVRLAIDKLNKIKPLGVNLFVSWDGATIIKGSLANVKSSLFEGIVLTILVIMIFLKSWRSTVITGLTLPITILGTIFFMNSFGFSLSFITLLALSLTVGLLVDDAIVVRENIVRHLHNGTNHKHAALYGTNEIGPAVLATTMALVAIFIPIAYMQGFIGKFFYYFGITITVAVLISLFVSFTLDPLLSSMWNEPIDGGSFAKSWFGRFCSYAEQIFIRLTNFYLRTLHIVMKYKKTILVLTLLALCGSIALGSKIGAEFQPNTDYGYYTADIKTKAGSSSRYTAIKLLELRTLLQKSIPEINNIYSAVSHYGEGSNTGYMFITIGSKDSRERSLSQIIIQSRQLLSNFAGVSLVSIGDGNGQPINVSIKSYDVKKLAQVSNKMIQEISKIKEVSDVTSSLQGNDPSLNFILDSVKASTLGINLAQMGGLISTFFAGNKIGQWYDLKTGQNYDVVVQIPQEYRTLGTLNTLNFSVDNASQGTSFVPLSSIVTIESGTMAHKIEHLNLERKVTITGNIGGSDYQRVFKQIDKIVADYILPDGVSIVQDGTNKDMQESFGYAMNSLLIGVLFIYLILVILFRSIALPLITMIALPLSFIGTFVALYLSGNTLNIYSLIGIVMLMGLSTKNGILLVDFINQQTRSGVDLQVAIFEAAKTRFRPILMTSLAMILGMLPLALSSGDGAENSHPMAFAVIGGLISSTVLTLLVLPVLYMYLIKIIKLVKSIIMPK